VRKRHHLGLSLRRNPLPVIEARFTPSRPPGLPIGHSGAEHPEWASGRSRRVSCTPRHTWEETASERRPAQVPCGSLTHLVPAQAPLPGHSLGSSSAPASAAARHLGLPDDPSAQRRRGIAPKNIATFNTHTEAVQPMVGARGTSYHASFPAQMGGGDEKALPSRRQAS
jgi:hypothetical protein